MSFFQSTEFFTFLACFSGGWFFGYWMAGIQARRERRRSMRTRSPQYIEVPFRGHGGRQVETLTCDRRQ